MYKLLSKDEGLMLGIIILRLVEEEICGEFLILVTGEVSLNGRISIKAQAT
jgi:hypothetical protein